MSLQQIILEFAPKQQAQPLPQRRAPTVDELLSDRTHVDRMRPLEYLQISRHAINGLRRAGILGVGGTYDAWKRGELDDWSRFGQNPAKELPIRFTTLASYLDSATRRFHWVRFAHDPAIGVQHLFFDGPEFDRLHRDDAARDTATLHFDKAGKKLRTAGIGTVGQLVQHLSDGIPDLPGFGMKSFQEVAEAALALSQSIDSRGNVDWLRYAQVIGVTVLPSAEDWKGGNADLLATFPEVALKTVCLAESPRDEEIFRERILKARSHRPILEDLGARHGVTRERIRQVEERSVTALREALFRAHYEQARFRFQPELELLFRRANEHLEEFGDRIWPRQAWIDELAAVWEVDPSLVAENLTLFSELFGFHEIELRSGGSATLIFPASLPATERDAKIARVEALENVLEACLLPISPADLVDEARKSQSIADDELESLLPLSPHIVEDAEGLLAFRFEDLSVGQQALRVLVDAGEPLHYDTIRERIVQRQADSPAKDLGNRITAHFTRQPGMLPVAKSGLWAYRDWDHVERRPLVEIAQSVLRDAGEAMPSNLLAHEMVQRRPFEIATLDLLLSGRPEIFISMGPHLWGLKEWGEDVPAFYWTHDQVEKFLEDYFAAIPTREVIFADLRKAFQSVSDASTRQVAGLLRSHPRLVVRVENHIRYATLLTEEESTAAQRKKKAARQPKHGENWVAINRWLHHQFDAAEDDPLPLATLVRGIEVHLQLPRHIGYSIINASEDFETFSVDRSSTKLCRRLSKSAPVTNPPVSPEPSGPPSPAAHTPASVPPQIPQEHRLREGVQQIQFSEWRAEMLRAIGFLTEDDADIAIMMAGKVFDVAMLRLQEVAVATGQVPVAPYLDDLGLKARIDWAVRCRLFKDRDTLHLLRKERNLRVHNLTGAQKAEIWRSAPLLLRKYIEQLLQIEQLVRDFLANSQSPTLP